MSGNGVRGVDRPKCGREDAGWVCVKAAGHLAKEGHEYRPPAPKWVRLRADA